MENKKYQVFISSTYKDLIGAREKIIETILSLLHFPVGMEMFSADDDEQWEIIKETIDVSDYYIVVIGHRYGSLDGSGVSFTEKEYDYAKTKEIPVLAFIRNRNIPKSPSERENDSVQNEKLDSFIKKASESKMCDFWDSEDELATKVAIALPKVFSRKPQIGWVRGTEAVTKEISQELAELSTENRNLREEIQSYENIANQNVPKIDVEINSEINVEIICSDLDPKIETPNTDYLDESNIPTHLTDYVTSEEIEKYNQSLPSEETLKKYQTISRYCYLIENESIRPKIRISNSGNAKANDVHISVSFPEFVVVLERSEAEKFEIPQGVFPVSPIEKAEEEYRERRSRSLLDLSISNSIGKYSNLAMPRNHIHDLQDTIINSQPKSNLCYVVSPQELEITAKSLIHTRSIEFNDEFVLVPVASGEGEIEVRIICEEYKEECLFALPVSVKLK